MLRIPARPERRSAPKLDAYDLAPEKRHIPHPAPIQFENNVWIGAVAVVTKGVTIGDNSVLAAGAVVTRDIPPNVIAAGVPAKVLRAI